MFRFGVGNFPSGFSVCGLRPRSAPFPGKGRVYIPQPGVKDLDSIGQFVLSYLPLEAEYIRKVTREDLFHSLHGGSAAQQFLD